MRKRGKKIFVLAFATSLFLVMMISGCAKEPVITLEQAKEIAVDYAGTDLNSVLFDKIKLEDGVYKLKFSDAGGCYECKISAEDGRIVEFDRTVEDNGMERTKNEIKDMSKDETENVTENISENEPDDDICMEGAISEEQACQIALDAAGLKREELKYLTSYVSWEQHVPYAYEVKFQEGRAPYHSYHYTIDLYTGDILEEK